MKRFAFIWFLIQACAGSIAGQFELRIDSTNMLIGDQVNLSLTVGLPQGSEWVNQDIGLPDSLTSIQTISSSEPSTNSAGNLVLKNWVIAPFDTGYLQIPGFPVVLKKGDETDTFYTNNIPIFVSGVPVDSTGMAPIKDIYEEPKSWIDYLWVFALIGIAALVSLFYYLMKNRKQPEMTVQEIVLPPHEIALSKLKELEAKKLWQKGEIKSYHVELTHIFREYLEGRYHIHALESTTEEIRIALKKTGLDTQEIQKTTDLLLLSDMVKFAKAKPRVEVHDELMTYTRDFITRTQRTFIQEEEE